MRRVVVLGALLVLSVGLAWGQADPYFAQRRARARTLLGVGIGTTAVGLGVMIAGASAMKNDTALLGTSFWLTMLGAAAVGGGGGLSYYSLTETQRWNVAVDHALEFSPREVAAIKQGEIFIGMSSLALVASWGYPDHINRTIVGRSSSAQYVYGSTYARQYVYVENGKVSAIQD